MGGLPLFVSIWFQIYFTPFIRVLFTFPSRYLFTIDLKEYLALPVSAGKFTQAIHVLNYSGVIIKEIFYFRLQDCYFLWFSFPANLTNKIFFYSSQLNGIIILQPRQIIDLSVWAFPFSLATTKGITIVLFSSGY
jgi:hypothetical protein